MWHTVEYRDFLNGGYHTLTFKSEAKTRKGVIRAAKRNIEIESLFKTGFALMSDSDYYVLNVDGNAI